MAARLACAAACSDPTPVRRQLWAGSGARGGASRGRGHREVSRSRAARFGRTRTGPASARPSRMISIKRRAAAVQSASAWQAWSTARLRARIALPLGDDAPLDSLAGAADFQFGLDIFITRELDLEIGFSSSSGALGPVGRTMGRCSQTHSTCRASSCIAIEQSATQTRGGAYVLAAMSCRGARACCDMYGFPARPPLPTSAPGVWAEP
jgi:hypothetical protein